MITKMVDGGENKLCILGFHAPFCCAFASLYFSVWMHLNIEISLKIDYRYLSNKYRNGRFI